MSKLNDFKKSVKNKRRFGRSGCRGGTSGRGHKGYKARSGSVVKGFEGGQTPLFRRLPMRGFNSNKAKKYVVVSLKKIISLGENGLSVIDNKILFENRIINKENELVKIIGSDIDFGKLKNVKKINVAFASKNMIEKLKNNGVELVLSNN